MVIDTYAQCSTEDSKQPCQLEAGTLLQPVENMLAKLVDFTWRPTGTDRQCDSKGRNE